MFVTKCGMCGATQLEEEASKLTGTAVVMNGVTRHACGTCVKILEMAFAAGKDGLTDPQKALEKMASEKEQLQRKVHQLEVMAGGGVLSLEEIGRQNKRIALDNPFKMGVPLVLGGQPLPQRQALPAAVEPAPAPEPAQESEAPPPAPEPKKGIVGRLFGGDVKKSKGKNK